MLVGPAETLEAAAGRDTDYAVGAPCRSQRERLIYENGRIRLCKVMMRKLVD